MSVAVAVTVPETAALDAALARLRHLMPQAVKRAENALQVALSAVRSSIWPEVAWLASDLTKTGTPVELSWSSRDPSMRWTAETSAPETPNTERLEVALDVLRKLGAAVDVPQWLRPHRGRELRFGAWVGGRHDDRRDRYKLYVDASGASVPAPDAIPARTLWRVAGLDASGETLELYGRLDTLAVWELQRLLTVHGLDAAPVIELAARLAGPPRDTWILPGAVGITVSSCRHAVVAAGLFIHAAPLLGNDAAIARRLHDLAVHYGWDTAIYDAILGDQAEQTPVRHGMFGFGVAADGKPWLQIGLRA